jgi:hypothetical protein
VSKTKITVIPIDLGYDLQELIAKGVVELTGQAADELHSAITLAKERDALKNKQKIQKTIIKDEISTKMEQAYDKILASGENGILCSDILNLVSDAISNFSAFGLRMKKLLRSKGNPYSLTRKKVQGNPHYVFIPYNGDETVSD